MSGKRSPQSFLVGMQTGAVTTETNLSVPQNPRTRTTLDDPAKPLLDYTQRDAHFCPTAALFTVAKYNG